MNLILETIPADLSNSEKIAQHDFTINFIIHLLSLDGKPNPARAPSIQQDQVGEGVQDLLGSYDPREVKKDVPGSLEEQQDLAAPVFVTIPAAARSDNGLRRCCGWCCIANSGKGLKHSPGRLHL